MMKKKTGIFGDLIPNMPNTAIKFEHGLSCGTANMHGYIYAIMKIADLIRLKDIVKHTRLSPVCNFMGEFTGKYELRTEYYLNFSTRKQRDRAYNLLTKWMKECKVETYDPHKDFMSILNRGISMVKTYRKNEYNCWGDKVQYVRPENVIAEFDQKYAFNRGYGIKQHEFVEYVKNGRYKKCRQSSY